MKVSVIIIICVLLVYMNVCGACNTTTTEPQPTQVQVPCFFIFGDSLVDNGNNNDILTLARANYAPYGIDFPQGPTGRFSNGLTVVDVLGIYSSYVLTLIEIFVYVY